MQAKTPLPLILFFLSGCISPGAVDGKFSALEARVDQKADASIVAQKIQEVNNKIEQTTQIAEQLSIWRKNVTADTINNKFGGAGWVVMGTSLIVIIFVGAAFLLIRIIIKRGTLLKLLTQTVYNSDMSIQTAIKKGIKYEVSNGGEFRPEHKEELRKFTKKIGTFIENKI